MNFGVKDTRKWSWSWSRSSFLSGSLFQGSLRFREIVDSSKREFTPMMFSVGGAVLIVASLLHSPTHLGLCKLRRHAFTPIALEVGPPDEPYSEEEEAAFRILEAEQAAQPEDMQCTARVVTNLVDATTECGKGALPDRFMMAMRAIRGEFSKLEPEADTERAQDSLLTALVNFPAAVTLRIVSRPLDESSATQLVSDVTLIGQSSGGAEVDVKLRGERRSIDLRLAAVPDAATLGVLREALKADDRVQMVF